MKSEKIWPYLTAVMGLTGYWIRMLVYATLVDDRNLLLRGNPLEWMLYLLLAGAAGLIWVDVRKAEGPKTYAPNFGPSNAAALGSILFAGGILLTMLGAGRPELLLELGCQVLGLAAAGCLLLTAWCRHRGTVPFFLLHCVVCVYLGSYMISHYRQWSSNPQLQDYVFQMLALVCMTLFAYEQAAFSLNMGKRRRLLLMGLMGALCCLTALAQTQDGFLYLTGAVWCLTGLCRWEPLEEPKEEPEELLLEDFWKDTFQDEESL